MKLISLTCPNCGAEIEVNTELTKGACNFCGKTFLIEDEILKGKQFLEQDGYNFEKGRIKAQKEEKERIERGEKEVLEKGKKNVELAARKFLTDEKPRIQREKNKKIAINIILIFALIIIIIIVYFIIFTMVF